MEHGLVVGYLGVAVGLAGVGFGIWWTRHQAKKTARSSLDVALEEHFELTPSRYQPDLSNVLKISWAGRQIENLVCLGLTLRLHGYHDYEDPGAHSPPPPGAPTRPRINFNNFRVISIGTQNNDPNLFEVPIAKAAGDTAIYLNVVRLRANIDARFTVIGEKVDEAARVTAMLVSGYMKQVDLRASGMGQVPNCV
jgi:hypothetical protein